MAKKIRSTLFALLFLLVGNAAQAAPLKILFFFPGGQGDQQKAQLFLDSFSEVLEKNSGGKIKASIHYLSDPEAGANFIKAEKPAGAILSQDVYSQKGGAWDAKVIARTLQLPSADGKNQYFLIGKKGGTLPSGGTLSSLSPQILANAYVQSELFPQLGSVQWQVQKTGNAVGELRSIGTGQKEALVLLDQYEWKNISRLRAEWVGNLAVLAESKQVPSAPFVVFPQNIPADLTGILQEALLKMGQDPAAQETLSNLRLKGFQKSSS